MTEYTILKTKDWPNVSAVYWEIEYHGQTYYLHSYYDGSSVRDGVYSHGPDDKVTIDSKWFFRGPSDFFANSVEKRILVALRRLEAKRLKNTRPDVQQRREAMMNIGNKP